MYIFINSGITVSVPVVVSRSICSVYRTYKQFLLQMIHDTCVLLSAGVSLFPLLNRPFSQRTFWHIVNAQVLIKWLNLKCLSSRVMLSCMQAHCHITMAGTSEHNLWISFMTSQNAVKKECKLWRRQNKSIWLCGCLNMFYSYCFLCVLDIIYSVAGCYIDICAMSLCPVIMIDHCCESKTNFSTGTIKHALS